MSVSARSAHSAHSNHTNHPNHTNHRRALHRSTSSLELAPPHSSTLVPPPLTPLRREFGSHGELHRPQASHPQHVQHVIQHPRSRPHPHPPAQLSHQDTGDSFFAMLQNIKPAITVDQRSPGPADYLKTRPEPTPDADDGVKPHASPKLRLKIHKFWATGGPNKMRPLDDSALTAPCFSDADETVKRRGFSHYDCQSLTANLGLAAKLRGVLLGRRRNTTTGASAASMLASRAVELDGETEDDAGDGCTNELIENCPFFRNEIGGEEERNISLNWKTGRSKKSLKNNISLNSCMHQPSVAYGLSILEFPLGQTHWNHMCYLSRQSPNSSRPIECQDEGALYYRKHFYSQEHQNWFGMDEQLGPIAISLRKEKTEISNVVEPLNNSSNVNSSFWQYRIIIRTAELLTIRGSILEDAIPNIKPSNNNKIVNAKEVIEYIAPDVQLSCLRLGISGSGAEEQLLRLDEQCISRHYKVGIMYCKQGQASEEDMYNNQEAGPALVEFLQMIGQTVRLKGFEKYKAGLDNKTDSTGLYSVYTMYKDCEIMFHVSTMLPYTPNNRQQLLRKRHIGNDIVTIVFQEPGAQRFTPKNIRSQFQHVFIVVRVINPCSDNTHYSIAVSRSKEVPIFGPPIVDGGIYPKGKIFTDLLLAKIINGENAAHRSTKFSTMATRTRQEYLKDLSKNYVSTTALDNGQKFSLFSSLLKTSGTSGMSGVKLLGNNAGNLNWSAEGAMCWPIVARDEGRAGALTECFLGLSRDTFVLIEECTRQIVFVAPTISILGWNWWGEAGGIRVYFHRGESVAVRTREVHDAGELNRALSIAAVSAAPAEQLQLRRNNAGQLGFHVQPDGVVTQVESGGGAARAGLRQGARLVEICTVAVCTLSHDQMVDLLKTSSPVTVTAIPPLSNGATRGCCIGAECPSSNNGLVMSAAQLPGRHRRRYERSFSPPRSSASSGYGTGSSSKSYCPPELWSADAVPLDSEKSPVSPENRIPYRSSEPDFSLNKIDIIDPPLSLQSSKVILTRRHSQEMANVSHSEFRGDKIWSDTNIERMDSSPRPQQNANSRRGTPASGHQSPAGTEARLRIPRTQRYSAGGNTTLKEDLMRLIDPDYIEGGNNIREEGILTQARPATVISSTSSGGSPAPNPPLPLPDARLMDWPSLVDTATRAMLQICEEQYPSLGDGEGSVASGGTENLDTGESWNSVVGPEIPSGPECCPLRRQVNELENKISKEIRTRRALEEEVKRLRHHNRRLREESMRAVQQLQRFTNWFFQTVERQ